MNQEEIFMVKFGELERQYEKAIACLRQCQKGGKDTTRLELGRTARKYRNVERRLQMCIRSCHSPAVAALSWAQLRYYRSVRRILQDKLPHYLHEEGGDLSANQAEAISLYGEYAIDFASQAIHYAQLAVLSAMDAQNGLTEQGKKYQNGGQKNVWRQKSKN